MIFIAYVQLDQQVHAQAMGFTSALYIYGWGRTVEEAQAAVTADLFGYADRPIGVVQIGLTLAKEQDLGKYTFPEQIRGLPRQMLIDCLDAKGAAWHWLRQDALIEFDKRQDRLRLGRSRLLEASRNRQAA